MLAKQAGEDGDDEEWEEDDAEETALEGYTTAVDDDENPVDEYQIFKAILQSKKPEIYSLAVFIHIKSLRIMLPIANK